MRRSDWVPAGVSTDRPSPARMYDALLGGSHNFEVDREAAARAISMVPDLPLVALSNRAFLRRAVRFLVSSGIRQFLDLGAGIPTVGNTHEVAQRANPECRVIYVDIDPVAVAHATTILRDNPRATAITADIRRPETVINDPVVQRTIDWDQPVGVLLVAVLHMVTDAEDPYGLMTQWRAVMPTGSYFAISHLTSAHRPDDAKRLGRHAANRTGVPIIFRDREQITRFFDGLTVVEPGVVELPQWRPETPDDIPEPPGRSLGLAGVGRKD